MSSDQSRFAGHDHTAQGHLGGVPASPGPAAAGDTFPAAGDTFHWAAVALVVAVTACVLSMAAGTATLAALAQACGFVSAAVAVGLAVAGLLLLGRGRRALGSLVSRLPDLGLPRHAGQKIIFGHKEL